jgi:chromosome segregation ATPase
MLLKILCFYNLLLINKVKSTNSIKTKKSSIKKNIKSNDNKDNNKENQIYENEQTIVDASIQQEHLNQKGFLAMSTLQKKLKKADALIFGLQKDIKKLKTQVLEEQQKTIEITNKYEILQKQYNASINKSRSEAVNNSKRVNETTSKLEIANNKNKQLEKEIINLKIQIENLKKDKINLNNQINIVNKKLSDLWVSNDLLTQDYKNLEKLLKLYKEYIKTLIEIIN